MPIFGKEEEVKKAIEELKSELHGEIVDLGDRFNQLLDGLRGELKDLRQEERLAQIRPLLDAEPGKGEGLLLLAVSGDRDKLQELLNTLNANLGEITLKYEFFDGRGKGG